MIRVQFAGLLAVLTARQVATASPESIHHNGQSLHYSTNLDSALRNVTADKNIYVKGNTRGRTRMNLKVTRDEFRIHVCEPFETLLREHVPGSTCSCHLDPLSVDCTLPVICETLPECGHVPICTDTSFLLDFEDGALTVEAIYSGPSDYEGQRTVITDTSCAHYWTLNGLEYQCQVCSLCPFGGIDLDCTNIQPNAMEDCVSTTPDSMPLNLEELLLSSTDPVVGRVQDSAFQLCSPGGPPLPTTRA